MTRNGLFPHTRLRRLRQQSVLRELVKETHLQTKHLILPLFIKQGNGIKKPILSMPGHYQLSIDCLPEEIIASSALGIRSFILFGIPDHKDPLGQAAYSDNGVIQTAIPVIKKILPDSLIFSDLCFCEYTDHGHCGVISSHPVRGAEVDNDQTLPLLAKQAISLAQAGADIIAPSGMMDGMVAAIRAGLDEANFKHVPILSYAVKYASSLYGPFREAAEGAPQFGDRKTYQMDIANSQEALRECALDIAEGADMLMVKPAHTYLDIIARVKTAYPSLPLGAYHTSGEFALIKAAASAGWVNEQQTGLEILTAIRRAGADFIITYLAKEAACWLQEISAS
jgi:porphobilinogen synthase